MFKCFKKGTVKPNIDCKITVWENKEKIKTVKIGKPRLVKIIKKDSFLLY
jgi:hypothetical protein